MPYLDNYKFIKFVNSKNNALDNNEPVNSLFP